MSALSQVVTNRDTLETLLCVAYVFEVSTSEHGAQHHIYRLVKDWYTEAQAIRPLFTTTTTTAITTTVKSTTAPPTDCSHSLLCFRQGWQVHRDIRLHSIAVQQPEQTRLHYRNLTEWEPLECLRMSGGHCACCNRHFVFSCVFVFVYWNLWLERKCMKMFFFCFLFFNPVLLKSVCYITVYSHSCMCDVLSGAHLVTTDIFQIVYRLQSGGEKRVHQNVTFICLNSVWSFHNISSNYVRQIWYLKTILGE